MLAPLPWLPLAALLVQTVPPPDVSGIRFPAQPSSVCLRVCTPPHLDATTTAPIPLTADLVDRFIAVNTDLILFWKAHYALYDTAQAHAHHPAVVLGAPVDRHFKFELLDYVAVASHEPAVAAIFARHKFAPAQFEPTQVAVLYYMESLVAIRETGEAPFSPGSAAGQTMILVNKYEEKLKAVGIRTRLLYATDQDQDAGD